MSLPGKQGLVAEPKDDFNCENPESKYFRISLNYKNMFKFNGTMKLYTRQYIALLNS